MAQTLTLTGYLGKDPQIRDTRSRTLIRTTNRREQYLFQHAGRLHVDDHDVVEERAEVEFTTTPRTFAVLSLATHSWEGGKRTTTWHRIVAWSVDRQHFGIRRLGKGDRIEITGLRSSFTTPDGRTIPQIELTSWRLLTRKPRNQPADLLNRHIHDAEAQPSPSCFVTCDGRSIPLAGEPIAVRSSQLAHAN